MPSASSPRPDGARMHGPAGIPGERGPRHPGGTGLQRFGCAGNISVPYNHARRHVVSHSPGLCQAISRDDISLPDNHGRRHVGSESSGLCQAMPHDDISLPDNHGRRHVVSQSPGLCQARPHSSIRLPGYRGLTLVSLSFSEQPCSPAVGRAPPAMSGPANTSGRCGRGACSTTEGAAWRTS